MRAPSWWDHFNDRLAATIFHPQFFAKIEEQTFLDQMQENLSGTFLDIGCGRQWYRPRLSPLAKTYLALDHPDFRHLYNSPYPVDYFADITKMPIKTGSVDMAMMIMVLEHTPDPEKAIAEVKRILHPKQGRLGIFALESYPSHGSPPNYTHWTGEGLSELLTRHGFKIEKSHRFGNFWEIMAVWTNVRYMETVKNLWFRRKWQLPGIILLGIGMPLFLISNALAIGLGWRKPGGTYALGHSVIARVKTSI